MAATGGILPFIQSADKPRVLSFAVGAATSKNTAGTSWKAGEVVVVTAASSDIDVAPDGTSDPAAGLVFLAAGSSEGMIVKAKGIGGATGDADGDLCPVYRFDPGVEFMTRNVFSGSDTNIGPAGSGAMTGVTIGADADLWRDNTNPGPVSGNVNGDFGLDLAGDFFTITRLLDSMGRDVSVSGGTPYWVVFARD